MALHEGILPTKPFIKLGGVGLPGTVDLERDTLLAARRDWDKRPQAKAYLDGCERVIHLDELVVAHKASVTPAVTSFVREVTRARKATMAAAVRLDGLAREATEDAVRPRSSPDDKAKDGPRSSKPRVGVTDRPC